jgi:hypothetical protein
MTGRDRIVLMAIVVLVVLAGGYVMVVSPERKQATEAQTAVQTAQGQLQSAEQQAASARAAQRRYAAAYSSVVSLGKAVPPADEVPSLIYELEHASNQRDVDFNSITSSATGSASGAAGASAATAASTAASASFTPMPFTFIFKGSFAGLAHLFNQVEGFAVRTNTGGLTVSGRLLTIQGVTITPESGGSAGNKAAGGSSSSSSSGALTATVTATAYVLPATQGLTGGASPSSPSAAGATTTASAGSTASSTPATPAVVKVTP